LSALPWFLYVRVLVAVSGYRLRVVLNLRSVDPQSDWEGAVVEQAAMSLPLAVLVSSN
jgi:hypothetical protein